MIETLAGTSCRISELAGITVEAVTSRRAEVWNKGAYCVIYIPKRLTGEFREYAKME